MFGLQQLDLSWNRLIGAVPPKFGELVQLKQLLLYDNQLTGSLPSTLGNLTSLEHFYADRNHFRCHSGEMRSLLELSL